MDRFDFLAACCWIAVVKPVGKLNPEIQNTLGWPLYAQLCSCSMRLCRSSIQEPRGFRE